MEKFSETKENIIQEAIQLIKKHGFDKVTINDICEASGISKHTFYYHFKSKEEVLMRFFHVPYDLTMKRMTTIISIESPLLKYWQLIEPRILHFQNLGPEIVKRVVIINLQKDIGTFRHKKEKEALHQLEYDLIGKAQEAKEINNPASPEQLAFSIRIQFVGLISLWAMHNHDLDLLEESRNLFKTLLCIDESVKF